MKIQYASVIAIPLIMMLSCKDNPEAGRGASYNWDNPAKEKKGEEFLSAAYTGGMLEIEVSNRMKNMLHTKAAKDLALAMISAHSAMNQRIKNLAREKNISLPDGLGEEQREKISKLESESGSDADKAYVDLLIADHTSAVSLFEKASKDAKDKEIKKFFSEKLPEIQHHLEMATAVQVPMK